MPFYLRKSIKLGPVRFNLSKSGIGTSVGVKGFRIGVRPNGKSYVHAGRHGLYYREELGGRTNNNKVQEQVITDESSDNPNTTHYNSASAKNLAPESRKELVDNLNFAYKSPRVDYILGSTLGLLSLYLLSQNSTNGLYALAVSFVVFIALAVWETKRRTVEIEYDFEGETAKNYESLISAFNNLASSRKVWAMVNSTEMYTAQEKKNNSGADNVVTRSDAKVGEGKPPWVKINIDIPVLTARSQTLYMMPDGILVYDSKGVGFVEYSELSIKNSTTNFIEEKPPKDAKIIDYTWKYPNKKGGPDKRYKDNYEIPICLYGELQLQSKSGMYVYLMTSKEDAALKFCADLQNVEI